jgi:hypothetical protein
VRTGAVLLLLALCACGSATPAAAPSARPRVASAVCDDLRTVVALRGSTPPGPAGQVSDAAGRVLVQLGSSSGAPEDVVAALRELEGGAPADDGLDATVSSWTTQECGG